MITHDHDLGDASDEPATETSGNGAHDGHHGNGVSPPPDDEPVGYKRPPKRHQFKPGQSGNPRGRPKGGLGLKTILKKELSRRMRIMEGSRRLNVSKLQMIVKRELEKAMDGDQRAIEHIINLNIQLFGLGDEGQHEEPKLTLGEELYLDAIMKRVGPLNDAEAGHPVDEEGAEDSSGEDDDEGA